MPDRNGRLTPDEIREAGQLAQRMANEQGLSRPTEQMIRMARSSMQNQQSDMSLRRFDTMPGQASPGSRSRFEADRQRIRMRAPGESMADPLGRTEESAANIAQMMADEANMREPTDGMINRAFRIAAGEEQIGEISADYLVRSRPGDAGMFPAGSRGVGPLTGTAPDLVAKRMQRDIGRIPGPRAFFPRTHSKLSQDAMDRYTEALPAYQDGGVAGRRLPSESDSAMLGPGVQRPPVDGPEARDDISTEEMQRLMLEEMERLNPPADTMAPRSGEGDREAEAMRLMRPIRRRAVPRMMKQAMHEVVNEPPGSGFGRDNTPMYKPGTVGMSGGGQIMEGPSISAYQDGGMAGMGTLVDREYDTEKRPRAVRSGDLQGMGLAHRQGGVPASQFSGRSGLYNSYIYPGDPYYKEDVEFIGAAEKLNTPSIGAYRGGGMAGMKKHMGAYGHGGMAGMRAYQEGGMASQIRGQSGPEVALLGEEGPEMVMTAQQTRDLVDIVSEPSMLRQSSSMRTPIDAELADAMEAEPLMPVSRRGKRELQMRARASAMELAMADQRLRDSVNDSERSELKDAQRTAAHNLKEARQELESRFPDEASPTQMSIEQMRDKAFGG